MTLRGQEIGVFSTSTKYTASEDVTESTAAQKKARKQKQDEGKAVSEKLSTIVTFLQKTTPMNWPQRSRTRGETKFSSLAKR